MRTLFSVILVGGIPLFASAQLRVESQLDIFAVNDCGGQALVQALKVSSQPNDDTPRTEALLVYGKIPRAELLLFPITNTEENVPEPRCLSGEAEERVELGGTDGNLQHLVVCAESHKDRRQPAAKGSQKHGFLTALDEKGREAIVGCVKRSF